MSVTVGFSQPYSISITVTPVVAGISLDSTSLTSGPNNAGMVIGNISVTTNPPGGTTGPVTLGGPDAARFAITNGGILPCQLTVGSQNIPGGVAPQPAIQYSITLNA